MAGKRPFFYGWIILGAASVCYGFGISPAYYTWGAFSSSIIDDLGFDRGDVGWVAGLFTMVYSCMGPFAGMAQGRWGIRPIMAGGFITTAIGLLYMSRANSPLDCYLGFSIVGGIGIGFATIVPCQTLGQNWFLKKRAMASPRRRWTPSRLVEMTSGVNGTTRCIRERTWQINFDQRPKCVLRIRERISASYSYTRFDNISRDSPNVPVCSVPWRF